MNINAAGACSAREQEFWLPEQNHAPAFRQNTRPLPCSETAADRKLGHIRTLSKILVHDLYLYAVRSVLSDGACEAHQQMRNPPLRIIRAKRNVGGGGPRDILSHRDRESVVQ